MSVEERVRIVWFEHTSSWSCSDMTVSKRVVAAKSQKYHKNVHRRGAVPELSSVRDTHATEDPSEHHPGRGGGRAADARGTVCRAEERAEVRRRTRAAGILPVRGRRFEYVAKIRRRRREARNHDGADRFGRRLETTKTHRVAKAWSRSSRAHLHVDCSPPRHECGQGHPVVNENNACGFIVRLVENVCLLGWMETRSITRRGRAPRRTSALRWAEWHL